MRKSWSPWLGLIAALIATGCETQHSQLASSTAPALEDAASAVDSATAEAGAEFDGHSRGRRDFYPLTIGNHWRYARTFQVCVQAAGSDDCVPFFASAATRDIVQECETTVDGRPYVVESLTDTDSAGASSRRGSNLLRQDRSGLYRWDGLLQSPPCGPSAAELSARVDREAAAAVEQLARDTRRSMTRQAAWGAVQFKRERVDELVHGRGWSRPGGVLPGEISSLRYPLRRGATWVIRDAPRFTATVIALEHLRVGNRHLAAWLISVESELFGPDDVVRVRYSPSGFAGLETDLRATATDADGNPIETVISRELERLTWFELARRRD
ncbi:MAG: hypothetical protein HOP12_02765 [Candidatus Eisenbacteria bacterium]|uniref:Uncharacterized protein n=1 Tax=Eiseniibacteriota bacterium TaxID=2212470 RepID=A0A849SCG5_UNCEI|nr:hypothetical protein [Candidatus Eisenbacteria bacterium]